MKWSRQKIIAKKKSGEINFEKRGELHWQGTRTRKRVLSRVENCADSASWHVEVEAEKAGCLVLSSQVTRLMK